MEVVKFLMVDLMIWVVFFIVAYIGYQHSYRKSFVSLTIQILSILISAFTANVLLNKVLFYIPSINIFSFIPDNFYYLIEPYEDLMIQLTLFLVLFLMMFIIVKSTLYVFSMNYEWERYIFPNAKFNRLGDGLLSILMSLLNAYSYVLVVLIIMACPLLNLVKPYSFTNVLLHVNPYISSVVDEFYEPYNNLKQGMDLFGDEWNTIFVNNRVDFGQLESFIDKNSDQRKKIHQACETFIPFIATTSGFMNFFPDNKIDEDEMAEYLNSVKNYIDNDVITLEIFNSYYKELIRNQTYDRLIQDKVISDEAIKTLINSDMLNEDNLKKIKNM